MHELSFALSDNFVIAVCRIKMSEVKSDGRSNGSGYSQKRKKNYYVQRAHKRGRYVLEPGLKGFLITCNNREKEAVAEAYRLLNEYADLLYGPVQVGL